VVKRRVHFTVSTGYGPKSGRRSPAGTGTCHGPRRTRPSVAKVPLRRTSGTRKGGRRPCMLLNGPGLPPARANASLPWGRWNVSYTSTYGLVTGPGLELPSCPSRLLKA